MVVPRVPNERTIDVLVGDTEAEMRLPLATPAIKGAVPWPQVDQSVPRAMIWRNLISRAVKLLQRGLGQFMNRHTLPTSALTNHSVDVLHIVDAFCNGLTWTSLSSELTTVGCNAKTRDDST